MRLKAGSLLCSSLPSSRKMPSSLQPPKKHDCQHLLPAPLWGSGEALVWDGLSYLCLSLLLGCRTTTRPPHISRGSLSIPSEPDLMNSVAMVKYQPLFSSTGTWGSRDWLCYCARVPMVPHAFPEPQSSHPTHS